MTVYVDDAMIPATVPNGVASHTSTWSHLMADTRHELIEFAARLGLRRAWLQDKPSGVHYDLTFGKREQAIRMGAVPIKVRTPEWVAVVQTARAQWSGVRA